MDNKFSPNKSQQKAIETRGSNILVSAGAGSGKTTVLKTRIVKLIIEGTPVDRFLVVTFTKTAAEEIKTRIRDEIKKQLVDQPNLKPQLDKIDESHIETFDAFALWVVKKYGYKINIDKDVDIIDNSIFKIELKNIINNIIDRRIINNESDTINLIQTFCVKNLNNLKEFIEYLIEKARKKSDKYKFLNDLKTIYFDDKYIDKLLEEKYEHYLNVFSEIDKMASELEDIDDANNICSAISSLSSSHNYDELYTLLSKEKKFPRKPSNNDVSDASFRDEIKKTYNNETNKLLNYGSSVSIKKLQKESQKYIETICDIACEAEKKLDEFKKSHNAYDFSDIALFCGELLNIEEVKEEIKNSFDYILVDEYQDTNDIQENVISKIGNDNVYMVGDVKQSIYRFRNANCDIFSDKYNQYKKSIGGVEIDLNTSFRSRKEIVNLINDMFEILMDDKHNIIHYKNGHHFEVGNKDYENNKDSNLNYNLEIFTYDKKEKINDIYHQALICAEDIIDKINNNVKKLAYKEIIDGLEKKKVAYLETASFKDFAIIMDRTTDFDEVVRAFKEKNIPIKIVSDQKIEQMDVTRVIKNLLKLVKFSAKGTYNSQFKYALASVYRSFLLEKDEKHLYDALTSKEYNFSQDALVQRIKKISIDIDKLTLEEIIKQLYIEFDIYERISALEDYLFLSRACDKFVEFASTMSKLKFSLDDFILYFDKLYEFDLNLPLSNTPQIDDAVTLINIHKSKGLEYTFCYFLGFNKKYNRQDEKKNYQVSDKYGVSLPLFIKDVDSHFFASETKLKERHEDFEEKIRLFYVALTRAKEKITILIPSELMDKHIYNVENNNSLIDFIVYLNNELKLFSKYSVKKEFKNNCLNISNSSKEELNNDNLTIKVSSIKLENHPIVSSRISKKKEGDTDIELLNFGTLMHFILENANYETKYTSFIENKTIKKYVDNLLNNDLFKDVKNKQILHEYEFFDTVNNTHGIIDCLIVRDHSIDIVDFKLKNISDEAYDRQLKAYRDYVATITNLPIKMYLLSIIDNKIREIN